MEIEGSNPSWPKSTYKIEFDSLLCKDKSMYKCEKCGSNFIEDWRKDKKLKKKSIPRFCSRICANSHIQTKEQNERRRIKLSGIKSSSYIDGRTKIERFCLSCGSKIKWNSRLGYCNKCYRSTYEYKCSLSESLQGKVGGYRHGSGRGKKGWYKGYFCDSSWELAFVIYCLENGVKITRNYKGFEYKFEEKISKYYPDFIMEDGSFIEIKGYMDSKNLEKINQFNFGILKIIGKKDIKLYIDYVKKKYGNNFISLYEGYKPRYKHICEFCGKEYENDKEEGVFCSRSCTGKFRVKYKS